MYITDIRDEDIEISVKVVIVGNGAVGKSSMIQRYCRGTFTKTYKKTIGVDFLEKQLRIHGEEVRLMLWDTAGQEEFDAITKAYYRGAQACVVAFSTTDRASLLAVRKWKKKVEEECGDIPMVLVQNKIDLISQSQIDQMEAERLAAECNMRLYRTSVKEDLNVGSVFQHLAENYVNKVKSYDPISSPYQSLQIGHSNNTRIRFSTNTSIISNNNINNNNNSNKSRQQRQQLKQQQQQQQLQHNRGLVLHAGYHHGSYSTGSSSNGSSNSSNGGKAGRRFSNYCDPCTDYLNNPMFESLHTRRSYWSPDKSSITLRPFSGNKKHSTTSQSGAYKTINVKSACKVL